MGVASILRGTRKKKKAARSVFYLAETTIEHGGACDKVAWSSGVDTGAEVVETHAKGSQCKSAETEWTRVGGRGGGLEDGVEGGVHVDVHLEGGDTNILWFKVGVKGKLLLLGLLWLLLWVEVDGMIDELVRLFLEIKDIF